MLSRDAAVRAAAAAAEWTRRLRNPIANHRGRWTRGPGLQRLVLLEALAAGGSANARLWTLGKEATPPARLTCDEAGHGDVCRTLYDAIGVVNGSRLAVAGGGGLVLPAGTLCYGQSFADSNHLELIAAGQCDCVPSSSSTQAASSAAGGEVPSSSSSQAACGFTGTVEVNRGLRRAGDELKTDVYELEFSGGDFCGESFKEELAINVCCPDGSSSSSAGGAGGVACQHCSGITPATVQITFEGVADGLYGCTDCDDYNTETFELAQRNEMYPCTWELYAPLPCIDDGYIRVELLKYQGYMYWKGWLYRVGDGVGVFYLGIGEVDDVDCSATWRLPLLSTTLGACLLPDATMVINP